MSDLSHNGIEPAPEDLYGASCKGFHQAKCLLESLQMQTEEVRESVKWIAWCVIFLLTFFHLSVFISLQWTYKLLCCYSRINVCNQPLTLMYKINQNIMRCIKLDCEHLSHQRDLWLCNRSSLSCGLPRQTLWSWSCWSVDTRKSQWSVYLIFSCLRSEECNLNVCAFRGCSSKSLLGGNVCFEGQ